MKIELSALCLYFLSSILCTISLRGLPCGVKQKASEPQIAGMKAKISTVLGIIGTLITILIAVNSSSIDSFYHILSAFVGLIGATGYLLVVTPANATITGSISSVFIIGSIFFAGFFGESWLNFGAVMLAAINIACVCILMQKMLSTLSITKFYRGEKNEN